jgi:hypothetical protein
MVREPAAAGNMQWLFRRKRFKPKIVIETMTILPEGQKRSNDFFGLKSDLNVSIPDSIGKRPASDVASLTLIPITALLK